MEVFFKVDSERISLLDFSLRSTLSENFSFLVVVILVGGIGTGISRGFFVSDCGTEFFFFKNSAFLRAFRRRSLGVFFLFDKDRIINGFLMFLPKKREMLSDVWLEMDEQLSNYVWGKGVEILIVGFSAAIIFGIMGLNYTALLSIIVGFSVLIPYVGAFLATIPVVVVALLQFGIGFDFYMIVGLYLLLQALDGNVLVPVLFSDAVKLHPVVIMLAVFIFGGIFGFWGAFFSIPLATFIKAVWNSWPSASMQNDF